MRNGLEKLQNNINNYIDFCNLIQNEYITKHQEVQKLNDIIEEKQNENKELKNFLIELGKKKNVKNLKNFNKDLKNKIKTQKKIKKEYNKVFKKITKKIKLK